MRQNPLFPYYSNPIAVTKWHFFDKISSINSGTFNNNKVVAVCCDVSDTWCEESAQSAQAESGASIQQGE